MKRNLLTAALFCISVAGIAGHVRSALPAAPQQPARIDAKAVWNPAPSVLADIRKVCATGDPDQQEACFRDSMRAAGASAEAAEFVREFRPHGLAYLRAFRYKGRVDIAYVDYVYRANENNGVFLVNGDPAMIDVDDYKYLSQETLGKNAEYAALKLMYPNVSIWPGDRYHAEFPAESSSADGGQNFVVEYLLQDGCHACARVGTARLKFDFDSSGRFQKVETVSVKGSAIIPGKAKASLSHEPGVMYVRMGKSFPVTLIANHTTGYSWRLANESEAATIAKKIGDTFRESFPGNPGSGGEEIWTFEPVAKGYVELDFEYVRPFEPNAVPVKTLNLRVTVE